MWHKICGAEEPPFFILGRGGREGREGRGGRGGREGGRECMCYVQLPDIFLKQSAGYQEDFNEERKDRERAHSKMADMEMQHKDQFNKLGEELMVSRQHCEQLERRLKEVESYYQTQLSQTKYSTGDREERRLKEVESYYQAQLSQTKYSTADKDKTISKLQAENKRLEVRVHRVTKNLNYFI